MEQNAILCCSLKKPVHFLFELCMYIQVKHKLTENEVLAVHGWLAVLILRSPDDRVGGDLCAVIKFQDYIIPLQLRLWGRLAVSAVVVWCGITDLDKLSMQDGCRTACVRFPPFASSLCLVQVSNV